MSEIELPLRDKSVRLVNPPNDDISEIEFLPRFSSVRFVKPPNTKMSDIKLPSRNSPVRFVKLPNTEMSDIKFSPRYSSVRLIAYSSPVKSLMLELTAKSQVNAAISDVVMGSPDAMSNTPSIAARRLESGNSTTPATISSNSTVTPLLWRVGMCVSMDTELKGFRFT